MMTKSIEIAEEASLDRLSLLYQPLRALILHFTQQKDVLLM